MRSEPNIRIEHLREVHPTLGGSDPGANWGYFVLGHLRIVSGNTPEWEHVSVSCYDRCPTWGEMQRVKELFWDDEETVIQIHPPKADYVNQMPYCLHLWRRVGHNIELPPREIIA